jgi:hypothetical protein
MIDKIEINDTYEASWLIMNEAKFIEFKEKPNIKRLDKTWIFVLENVSETALQDWKDYKAIGNIRNFEYTRKKLKEKIKKLIKWKPN